MHGLSACALLCGLLAVSVASIGCRGDGEGPAGPRPPQPLCDPEAPPDVGPAPLRRLTREQYDNTVRDLLDVEGSFAGGLSPDEQVGAFDSNAIAPVSRTVVEQYLETAEDVAEATDLDPLDDCNRLVTDPEDCARDFVRTLGPRAYRRPLSDDDVERLLDVYRANAGNGHRRALRVVIEALLMSPRFLYHGDYRTQGPGPGDLSRLDDWALASRLSYFLWNTMPDEELFDAAETGELHTVEGLRAQAERMLADPRAADAIASFHRQWLGIDELLDVPKDTEKFPRFDPAMRRAMLRETERFADHVIREADGSLRTLLTASFSFLEGPLFDLYGVRRPEGHDAEAPVELDPDERHGLLTHGSVLAAHAHNRQSSLTLRGKLVRENVFCQELPDPPPDVDLTLPEPEPGASTRERFATHVENPTCAGCHRLTDEIGFAFEHYDAIGAFRERDNGAPVDASGELEQTDVDGPFEDAGELVQRLADSEEVERCVARQWFRFALGRGEAEADACSMQPLYEAMKQPDDLRSLIVAIVTSPAFRYRAPE